MIVNIKDPRLETYSTEIPWVLNVCLIFVISAFIDSISRSMVSKLIGEADCGIGVGVKSRTRFFFL